MLDHQQRPWNSVALVPQFIQVPYQEQLGLALQETPPAYRRQDIWKHRQARRCLLT